VSVPATPETDPHPSQSFFARRWRGEVPMRTVFWRDMLGVGTAANVAATFLAFMAAVQGASAWVAAVIHFAPLPYNVFLYAAVGRALPRHRGASMVALAWLAVMTFV
jgi:hypothetical protein